jgi:hypothetical protein
MGNTSTKYPERDPDSEDNLFVWVLRAAAEVRSRKAQRWAAEIARVEAHQRAARPRQQPADAASVLAPAPAVAVVPAVAVAYPLHDLETTK